MRLHKFNRRWALIKLNLRQNKEKYIRVGTLVFSIVIFIIGITFFAFAKFSTQDKYNVMQSTVGTFVEGDYILASYLDGNKQDNLPTKSDSISVDHIDCDNGATGTWNYTDWAIYITGATKRTKCTVYFVTQAHTGATEGDSKLGTASVDQVLSGATFSSTKGTNITGTMANNGALNWAPTSSTTQTVTPGYYSGGTLDSSGAYNAGVSAADARTNTGSASYTAGYNAGNTAGYNSGVSAADARVNTSSASYTSGYNNGYSAASSSNSFTITNLSIDGYRDWADDSNQTVNATAANSYATYNVSAFNSVTFGTITLNSCTLSVTLDGTAVSVTTGSTISVASGTSLLIQIHASMPGMARNSASASASISSVVFNY
jgi:hypothetical protein